MTTHNVLYILPDGSPKNTSSYSARQAFRKCKRYFQLTRVLGYRRKEEGVATDLGKIVEAAISFHLRFGHGGVENFVAFWTAFRESKNFEKRTYTDVEESWENCLRIGREWLTIFELRAAKYPFHKAMFQLPLRKTIFPNTSYSELKNVAYIDIFSQPDPSHPLLVNIPPEERGETRPLITDVKTASKELPKELIALDPQLIEYAWQEGNALDVGFLWLVKKSHGMKSGSRITLLIDAAPFRAGDELIVLDKEEEGVWIGTNPMLDAYDRACRDASGASLRGNALKVAAAAWLMGSPAVNVPLAAVSKQLVQFATARLTRENVQEMGRTIGQATVEMVVAHEQDFYPMEPGLRFPEEKCTKCDMRYICAGDTEGRDKFLSQVGFEWLDSTIEE